VAELILAPLASAEAVLEADEKELGVALIDIGGGTTDIAIYNDGALVHTAVLSLSGGHVTNDIAVGLRTPAEAAEVIKRKYGCALPALVDDEDMMEVPSVGGRNARRLSRRLLVEIVEPRVEELFQHIHLELTRSGYLDTLAAGVVITGGATNLQGMPELAETVLGLPARRGLPRNIGGLVDVAMAPEYATSIGLIQLGAKGDQAQASQQQPPAPGMIKRMGRWFGEMF
jgi:cell division protein FtsA